MCEQRQSKENKREHVPKFQNVHRLFPHIAAGSYRPLFSVIKFMGLAANQDLQERKTVQDLRGTVERPVPKRPGWQNRGNEGSSTSTRWFPQQRQRHTVANSSMSMGGPANQGRRRYYSENVAGQDRSSQPAEVAAVAYQGDTRSARTPTSVARVTGRGLSIGD